MIQIRAVKETDDFEAMYNLINDTLQRFSGNEKVSFIGDREELKKEYCNPDNSINGFIAVKDNTIVAFMGVSPSRMAKNGYITFGFLDGFDNVLEDLLNKCRSYIQEIGGTKIFVFTSTKFGQVRNKGISLWEKLGFIADEYGHVTLLLDLREWNEPEHMDLTGIEPTLEMNYDDIKRVLIEDGEEAMAESFQDQYSSNGNPDQVILTLRDHVSNEIAGIAYYRVDLCNRGTDNEFLDAYSFGLHVRPKYLLNHNEIRRFLIGTLFSMKQLNIYHVITRITLKNFNVFAAMVTEGFHNENFENTNILRLHRNI
ncbi:MAG TPA: hypothetical protein IAA29_18800 [Candidatus Paenibacillus intestinavium]|nr:hypothetical protein [Candidatus Paenibacillus intestinavium]